MTKRPLWILLALALPLASCAAEESYTPLGDDGYGSGKADAISSESPDRLVDIPYYFAMPKSAISVELNRAEYPQPTLWNPTPSTDDLGLRIIAVEQGESLSSRKRARRAMADTLAPAGVLQTGDIILSFRPEMAGTMAYPHIQMGTTHSGVVIIDANGEPFNLDSPLDFEYNGKFDAKHYAGEEGENGNAKDGTHALHVLRPRIMNEDGRRERLAEWAGTLKSGLSRINGERRQIKFQSDYLVPAYFSHGATPRQMVTTLGKIILEDDTDTQLPMYCSEFAWHMLALSNCSPDEILNAPDEGAACVDAPFEPMPLVAQAEGEVGIAEGPLRAIAALSPEIQMERIGPVFQEGNAGGLSSGHRAVAESVAPLMAPLEQYYQGVISGASTADLAPLADGLSAEFPRNYSPTAYFIAAMGDEATRTVDYVVTVAFVDAAGFSKARGLAQLPVP